MLLKLKSHISSSETPEGVLLLAMNYCFQNPVSQMADLLDLYKLPCFSYDHFLDALHNIMKQTGHIPSNILFTLAVFFEANKREDQLRLYYDNFHHEGPYQTIDIIRKAFEMLKQENTMGSGLEDNVKWVYQHCTQSGVLWSDTFWELLNIIHKNGTTHPKIVLLLLGGFVDMDYIGQSQRDLLAETLIAALRNNLLQRIEQHRGHNYLWVVKELTQVRTSMDALGNENQCKLKEVASCLMSKYYRKRRLRKMLEEFCNDNE